MSGVAGIIHGGPGALSTVQAMAQALAHRAPEGLGFWADADAALAILRDQHCPEPLPDDPSCCPESGRMLSADLRLDNRDELATALSLSAGERTTLNDEDLLLRCYQRWGTDCLPRLLGDFAFAIWDPRERSFFAARDSQGARPFYYCASGSGLAFASETKALLGTGMVDGRDLDETRVAAYLAGLFLDASSTFFRQIHRLPPGHSLHLVDGQLQLRRFWQLDGDRHCSERDPAAQGEAFRQILDDAVRCRLRGRQTTGVLLSGGLDSSALACLARSATGPDRTLHTVSATFPDYPQVDEQAYIQQIVDGGGISPLLVPVSQHSPLQTIRAEMLEQDEPFYLPNLYVHTHLARAARQAGLRVLLDGVDGDTCVGHGMEYLAELCLRGRLWRAIRECRALGRRFRHPAWRFLVAFGILPGPLAQAGHLLRRSIGRHLPRRPSIAAAELWQRVGWPAGLAGTAAARAPATSLRQAHHQALTSPLIAHFLEVHDRSAAACGIQPRHPYLDQRLVEFCASLPATARLREGWDRVVQRDAMAGRMPDTICWRVHKSHWGQVFQDGLLRRDAAAIESLLEGPLRSEPYLDTAVLRAIWQRCRTGVCSETEGMQLWRALSLEIWLQAKLS